MTRVIAPHFQASLGVLEGEIEQARIAARAKRLAAAAGIADDADEKTARVIDDRVGHLFQDRLR